MAVLAESLPYWKVMDRGVRAVKMSFTVLRGKRESTEGTSAVQSAERGLARDSQAGVQPVAGEVAGSF